MGEYSRLQRGFECVVLVVFGVLAVWGCSRLSLSFYLLFLAALLAWLATDFASGLIHWTFDTWGSPRTPFFGPWFIRAFREHHADPRAMTRHDFVETNGSSALAGLPLLLVGVSLAPGFAQAFVVFLALGGLVANQCHKWAHLRNSDRSPVVRLLQRAGLTLSPEIHRRHHARPHATHYCTASGWLNWALERTGFFRGLEIFIAAAVRAAPRGDEIA